MVVHETLYAISAEVWSLPESWRARNGHEFRPQDDFWKIPDTTSEHVFNFASLRKSCSREMVQSCKRVLLWYVQSRSLSHATNMFNQFKWFSNGVCRGGEPLRSVANTDIINYKGSLSKEHQYYLGSLSGFLQKWHELGYSGIDPAAYSLLRSLRIEGNRKGWAVLTMDPAEGPFTQVELQVIHQAVNKAFAEGDIDSREFSLVWLFMATGARPIQIADLKIKDFHALQTESGTAEYILRIPRAKQRGALRRAAFKDRPLIPQVGDVIHAYITQVKIESERCASDMASSDDLPIFPIWNKPNSPGFSHHPDALEVRKEVKELFSKLEVFSHRTGEPIQITPRRFRYTLGTRAAQEKLGPLVIAEMMDHNDTQNVMVYTKATPEIIKKIDEALALELAPLARAFAGEIILSDDEAGRAGDPASLIRHPGRPRGKDGVGRCGRCGSCEAAAPIACYTCRSFQAWADTPHEDVLKTLLDERARLLEVTGDERIAHANDNVILAVAQVVEMCRKIREERGGAV